MVAAAIRYKNPGAMWGNALARKWGAEPKAVTLNDGLGQGNNIAVFPTYVQGACAQFDLWRTGYCNKTLKDAILKWSGGNWSQPYANFLTQSTGISMSTMITPTLLASPQGWRLMKAQAQWEAGQVYPMTDNDWIEAQRKVFGGKPPTTLAQKKAASVVVVGTVGSSTAVAASSNGAHWFVVVSIIVACAIIAAVVYAIIHNLHHNATAPTQPRSLPLDPEALRTMADTALANQKTDGSKLGG